MGEVEPSSLISSMFPIVPRQGLGTIKKYPDLSYYRVELVCNSSPLVANGDKSVFKFLKYLKLAAFVFIFSDYWPLL